jgi:hypothetical protein
MLGLSSSATKGSAKWMRCPGNAKPPKLISHFFIIKSSQKPQWELVLQDSLS